MKAFCSMTAAFLAERGGEDTSRGIALVKIEAQGLTPAEFVHPRDVRVGQWAFALGRTFGLGSRMGGESVHLKVQKKDEAEPVAVTVDLADAPWEECKEAADAEPPPSFPMPKAPEGGR